MLEKYEKSEFKPSDFGRDIEIPTKMEKPILDGNKKEPQQETPKNDIFKVC